MVFDKLYKIHIKHRHASKKADAGSTYIRSVFMLIPGSLILYQAEEISSPPVNPQSVPEAFHRLYSPSGISVGSQL